MSHWYSDRTVAAVLHTAPTQFHIFRWVLRDPKMAQQMDYIRAVCAELPATGCECLMERSKTVVEQISTLGQDDVWA